MGQRHKSQTKIYGPISLLSFFGDIFFFSKIFFSKEILRWRFVFCKYLFNIMELLKGNYEAKISPTKQISRKPISKKNVKTTENIIKRSQACHLIYVFTIYTLRCVHFYRIEGEYLQA